ncbi:MAG TPA: hypothetical protein VMS64_04845 [Candidatus Methylomirabilis sp.]|nr:hypothetical protein [Candidatus Methylomirabilis sp.]
MSPERADVPARDASLTSLLRVALTDPASLCHDHLAHVHAALQHHDDPASCERALDTLAGVLYARPDLFEETFFELLGELARWQPLPGGIGSRLTVLLRFMAGSPAAPDAWALLHGLLCDARIGADTRARLLPLVEDFVQWREDLIGVDGVLDLAESPLLDGHRVFLLDYGIERFVWSAPETFTAPRLERIAALFATAPRYRYFLYSLAGRPGLAPEVRPILARQLAGQFPRHDSAAVVLTGRPMRFLVVFNLGQGQGDDVVRLAPLLQALLDANPALIITLVTWRPYLYDCPRVTPIAIHDDPSVRAALAEPFDGILEFFQPGAPDFTFRVELHAEVERLLAEHRPAFLLRADLGRVTEEYPGGRSPFLYQTVELNGADVAKACGLDQFGVRNIYEPGLRLLAELGLPQRAGEEAPRSPSVLTGIRSADAEHVWADLVGGASGVSRPVALVNPFGGSGRTKGFLEQEALLVAEIEALVDEGYRVVLLPNGTAWGGPSAITGPLERLDPGIRAHVTVAPDPAESVEAAQVALGERPELRYGDKVMRLFKYFATYADLVVTVEGWLSHYAYNLGRPFRLFLAAGSFSLEWCPHGRSKRQRIVAVLSPGALTAHCRVGLLRDGDPAPLPHRPRKVLLETALPGLGCTGEGEALAVLRRALTSLDHDVRTWAAAGLGRNAVAAKATLLAALDDPWPTVVREAADALLRENVDCSRELGPRFRQQLQAHADVVRRNWEAVGQAGSDALPALFRGGKSEYHDVRHEAKQALREVLGRYLPGRFGAGPLADEKPTAAPP